MPRTDAAFEVAGFVPQQLDGKELFLESLKTKTRDGVHVLFSGERVPADDSAPAPDVSECDGTGDFRVLALPSRVRMKLDSYRRVDRVHLRDMLDVGLIDESWLWKLPPELAARLKTLIDDPDG